MRYAKIESYNKDNIRFTIAFVLIAIFTLISFFYVFKFVFNMSPFQTFSVRASEINNSYTLDNSKIVVGQATKDILEKIKITGFSPVVVSNIKRDFFSAQGQIITLGGDNIEVFEYSDNGTALSDISLFQNSSETRVGSWKKNINLYASGNLIVFYMGENEKIISSLNSVLGQRFIL